MQRKLLFAVGTAAVVAVIGGVAVVDAQPSPHASPLHGYARNQCKDPQYLEDHEFKNRGQCIQFYARAIRAEKAQED